MTATPDTEPRTNHPNLVDGSRFRAHNATLAKWLPGSRESGPPTAYRLDPNAKDPAVRGAWTVKRHPRGVTMTSRVAWIGPVAFAAVFATAATTCVTLYVTGTVNDSFLVVIGGFLALCAVLCIVGLVLFFRVQTPAVVLKHDAMTDTLTLHSKPIDADDVLAVERVAFASGLLPPSEAPRGKKGGGSYTSYVHLVLKTRLPNPADAHPSSNEPGTRFHTIAITHMGLGSHGEPIAKSLNVPYTETSLGIFAMGGEDATFEQIITR